MKYDALLLMSFGGPEGMDDVMPFLENVLRGKNVPHERLVEVSHHYHSFGGRSPINDQNRQLKAAIEQELKDQGVDLPVYWGNRNWKPFVKDTIEQMQKDGIKNILSLFTSSYSCYSGCRQYREDIQTAKESLDNGALSFDKIRVWYNHPDWIEVNKIRIEEALSQFPLDQQDKVHIAFTAHSIPDGMAKASAYEKQLSETSRLVAEALGIDSYKLVYQSRSGSPNHPWLEPDICDYIETLKEQGIENLIISPIGFISDHMEVLYDLDDEAREACEEQGIDMVRAGTAGTHPVFVRMLVDLIKERHLEQAERKCIGKFPANHDVCPENCCLSGRPAR